MRDPKTIERKFCTNPVPDVLSAIETAKKIVHNILANASNEKVRKLRKGNSNIEKFLECNGVASFLERLGFKYHEKSVTRDEKGNTVEVFTGWSKPIKPNDTAGFEDTLNWLQHVEKKIKGLAKNGPLASCIVNVQLLPPKNDFRGKFVTLACNLDERFGDFIADVRSDFKKEMQHRVCLQQPRGTPLLGKESMTIGEVLELTPRPGRTDRIKLIVDILGEDGKPKEVQKSSEQAAKEEKKRKQEIEQADREDKIKRLKNEDRIFKDNQIKNYKDDRSRRESPEQELARLKREEKKRKAELAGMEQEYENRRLSDSTDRLNPHDAATKVHGNLKPLMGGVYMSAPIAARQGGAAARGGAAQQDDGDFAGEDN